MPFAPAGLESQKHPLKHRFDYSFGLSGATGTMNSAWVTIVKNYKGVVNPNTIKVNPHNDDFEIETGAVCSPMSIIDRVKIIITASKSSGNNTLNPIKFSWTPFFCSFGEKYDATDEDTSTSVASIMQLTKDATQEDITPLTTNKLPVTGNSDKSHPLSTANVAELYNTHLNMTTDATMEDTPFNMESFQKLLSFGTNKGALKSCLGRTRRFSMSRHGPFVKTFFIKKFVPRVIRRIVPYTFFGILFHMPLEVDVDSYYQDSALTTVKSHIGFRVLVRYDEWNESHSNTMVEV